MPPRTESTKFGIRSGPVGSGQTLTVRRSDNGPRTALVPHACTAASDTVATRICAGFELIRQLTAATD